MYREPTGTFAPLADHVTFSWEQLDWFEEDERVFVHARDPHHRVDAIRSSRVTEVHVRGQLLARTLSPVLLFETSLPTRFYLPYDDVRTEFFEPSDLITMCPYKGTARYWSVRVGDRLVPNLAWQYPDPIPENRKIKDLVCFFNERVDLAVDGEKIARPRTPWSQPSGAPDRASLESSEGRSSARRR
jgi:uncharacterized protein (DUF427 family)